MNEPGLGFVAALLIRAPLVGMLGGLGYALVAVVPSLGRTADWPMYVGSVVFVASVSVPVSWIAVLGASALGVLTRAFCGRSDGRQLARRVCVTIGFGLGITLDVVGLSALFPTVEVVRIGYVLVPIACLWVYRYAAKFDDAPEPGTMHHDWGRGEE